MQQKSKHSIDMINGPLAGKILLFAMPLMLSGLLQLTFNAADVIVVGRFAGKEALAAVGSCGALINLFLNVFMGLSVGTNIVVAQDLGAGKLDKVHRSVHTAIAIAALMGVVLMVIGALLARQMLQMTRSPDDVIDLATVYLRIYFFGTPANMLYNFGASILRAQGDTKRPLYFLTAAGVLNVGLNLVFVIVFHMSAAGVALATILSQYLSAVLVLRCLMKDTGPLRVELKKLCLDGTAIRRMAQLGLPAGFQGALFALSNVVIQSTVNSFGSVVVAACSAAGNIEGFVWMAMNTFTQTSLTFVSQNYGAGKFKRLERSLLLCILYTSITGLITGSLTVIFGHSLVSVYAPGQEEVITHAITRMKYVCLPYFLCGCMESLTSALRGIGYSLQPMLISLFGACGLRILYIATIFPFYNSIPALFISYPISWSITGLCLLTMFLSVRKKAYTKIEQPEFQRRES